MALPDVDTFERAGLKAWPGIEVEWDRQWVRRAANGYTKRANSVQCFDREDDADAPSRIAAAVAWFAARNIRPAVRVTPQAGQAVVSALDAAGWTSIDHSSMLAMELRSTTGDPRATLYELLDSGFLSAQQVLRGYDDAQLGRLRAVLAAAGGPGRGIVVRGGDGRPLASALMIIGDGIVVTGNVIVAPAARRQGLGKALMQSGLAWAHAEGARIAALNVMANNTAALALYRGLGFRHQYDYTYRVPPQ